MIFLGKFIAAIAWCLLLLLLLLLLSSTDAGFVPSEIPTLDLDGLYLCQENCVSSERLTGATKMLYTRQHPWKIAQYPSKQVGFCKLGCQLFFTEYPKNITCKRMCDFSYRYKIPVEYSDIAEEAIKECRDGCDIALAVCQAGYYCNNGQMIACPPGRYRDPIPDLSVGALKTAFECFPCPYGRYRFRDKGKNKEECTYCPIGKYANVLGSVLVSDCQRCPAGKHAEQTGMRLCKCITRDSCQLSVKRPGAVDAKVREFFFVQTDSLEYGIDYFRETIPFMGRW